MSRNVKMLFICLVFSTITTSIFAQNFSCTNNRYIDNVFDANRNDDIYYATAEAVTLGLLPYLGENNTYTQDLEMDIYVPQGDTLSKRPCVVFAFGGAFITGTKRQPQIVEYCEFLASRGYVCAAIDYRLGFNLLSTASAVRAVYRGAQDVRAAIRFLKANASTWGIDTSYVFAGGNSAGAISALHAAYGEEAERATIDLMAASYGGPAFNDWPDLGCLACAGNNFGGAPFNISGKPDLVINMWGALGDTTIMNNNQDISLLSFHGENDDIVVSDFGSPFSYPIFPPLYGSIPLAEQADNVGIPNELNLYDFGHEVWFNDANREDIKQKSLTYFYNYMKPQTPILSGSEVVCGTGISTYSILPIDGATDYCWNVLGGTVLTSNADNTSIEVIWDNNAAVGSVQVKAIDERLYESDIALISVTINPLLTPTNLTLSNVTTNSATISWGAVTGNTYLLEYKQDTETIWTSLSVGTNTLVLDNLDACQTYDFRVSSICGTLQSMPTWPITTTTECITTNVKVYLSGAYDATTNQMSNYLRSQELLPINQPYFGLPWIYQGQEIIGTASMPTTTVDWILLELRPADNPSLVAGRRAALLLQDGTVVDFNNEGSVLFPTVTQAGDYYLVVRHRNHEAIISSTSINLPTTATYDFTTSTSQAMNSAQVQLSSGQAAMYAGDYDANGLLTHEDYNSYLQENGINIPTYKIEDGNFDGMVNNDDFIIWQQYAGHTGSWLIRY